MLGGKIDMVEGYRPNEDEPFMNERQRDYFRRKLVAWKEEILREASETILTLQNENDNHPQRKLISKIDSALARLSDGSYGFCEETGEPIALRRLDARPIATLTIEAQERHERRERIYRDD
jgi:DnaK suppressor protein